MFNVEQTLKKLAKRSDLVSPGDFATALLATMTAADYKPAFQQIVRAYMQTWLSRQRMRNREDVGRAYARGEIDIEGPVRRPSAISTRRYDVVDVWMNEELAVGDKWMCLGDCTVADLMTLSAQRRGQAAKCEAIATQYDGLAAAMQAAGAPKVRDLPRATISQYIQPVAA